MAYDELKNLLAREELYVHCKERLYNAIISWVKHKIDERKVHLEDLISHVDFSSLGADFLLRHVTEEPLIRTDHEFMGLLLDCIQNELHAKQVDPKFKNVLLIPNDTGTCQMYYLPHWKYFSAPSMKLNRRQFSTVFGNNLFYILGGLKTYNSSSYNYHYNSSSTDPCNSVEIFDPFTLNWMCVEDMPTRRYNCGVCILNNMIYVCGGQNNNNINTMDMYNMETDNWITELNVDFQGYTKSVSLCNAVYSFTQHKTASFDPREMTWKSLSNPSAMPNDFGLIAINEMYVYRIGLKNNDMYDIRNNTWMKLSTSPFYRSYYGVINFEKYIYIVGGKTESAIKQVLIYNTKKDEWHAHPLLQIECSNASAATLSNF